jgi:predicted Zn-dependent protease
MIPAMIPGMALMLAFAPWQAGGDLESLMKTGLSLAEQEKYAEAAQVFAKCAKEHPESFEAGYNLALARFALKEYSPALAALDAVPAAEREEKAARDCLRGKVFLATGRDREGLERMAGAFRMNPADENCALDLGMGYIRAQAYVPAIEVLEKAPHKDSELLLLELALAQALAGRHADAIRTSSILLKRNADSAMPRLIAAFSYYMDGKYRECAKEASAGLAGSNANPYFYYLRAGAEWKMNAENYAGQSRDLATAAKEVPGCGVCFLALSKVHEKMGDDQAAIADLTSATRLDQTLAQAWYRLSILYRKQGNTAEAEASLKRYHAIKSVESEREQDMFRRQAVDMLGH